MATDYAKKKNDDLIALCKDRGLPHTGKKADFVKRLEDYDAKQGTSTTTAPTTVPAPKAAAEEDEILDFGDDDDAAGAATTAQAADAIAAGGVGEVKNPVAVPNQELAEDPAKTDDLTIAAAPATGEQAVASANGAEAAAAEVEAGKDFTSGIAERTIDEEIERRKARARKFGMPEDSDEIKMLERAKKFGITDSSAVPGLLNKALSEGRERKRALDGALSDGAGVRKRSRGPGGRGRGGRRQASGRSPAPAGGAMAAARKGEYPSWMSEADKAKAEARKAKFAA